MAANGISTLPTKSARVVAKIALVETKRSTVGAGYRQFNVYIGTRSPTPYRPWGLVATPPVDGGNAATTVWTSYIDGDFADSTVTETFNGGFAV
jgi:hypothetical protein